SRSDMHPSLLLERVVHKTKAEPSHANSIHAWEEASLKFLPQVGESEGNARDASVRYVNPSAGDVSPFVQTATDRPRWYRKPGGGAWTFGLPKESPGAP